MTATETATPSVHSAEGGLKAIAQKALPVFRTLQGDLPDTLFYYGEGNKFGEIADEMRGDALKIKQRVAKVLPRLGISFDVDDPKARRVIALLGEMSSATAAEEAPDGAEVAKTPPVEAGEESSGAQAADVAEDPVIIEDSPPPPDDDSSITTEPAVEASEASTDDVPGPVVPEEACDILLGISFRHITASSPIVQRLLPADPAVISQRIASMSGRGYHKVRRPAIGARAAALNSQRLRQDVGLLCARILTSDQSVRSLLEP